MTAATTYDEIPYHCILGYDFQPSALATMATLYGLQPPPVGTSRILDLGCGDGTNIIGIAQSLPQATCLGVDFSTTQIESGQKAISGAGLTNVELRCADIADLDENLLGTFDYIVVHGTYSWVDGAAQEKILTICKHNLSAKGIAYISYNLYPGWFMQRIIRDLMIYHTAQFANMETKIKEAREILRLVTQMHQQQDTPYAKMLQVLSAKIDEEPIEYIGHEYLEAHNYPIYFSDFTQKIHQSGLEYVTDVEFRRYLPTDYEMMEAYDQLFQGNFWAQEQYLDFFYNRNFRSSILCHQHLPVSRELDWELMPKFYVAANIPNLTPDHVFSNMPYELTAARQQTVKIENAFVKAALLTLTNAYPQNVAFTALFNHLCSQLTPDSLSSVNLEELQNILAEELHYLYCLEAVELNVEPLHCVTQVSEQPLAPPLARWQAQNGGVVANMQCKTGELDAVSLTLMPYLDGQHSKADLLTVLMEAVNDRRLSVHIEEVQLAGRSREQATKDILTGAMENSLQALAKNALLVG